MRLARISQLAFACGMWVLASGCTTYKVRQSCGTGVVSDRPTRPIPVDVRITDSGEGTMLIGERMPLELVQRLQRSGLFERIHSAAASPERVAASLEHNCTEQSRVNRADTLAKVYLMALTLGATAPLTPFKEEREFSMTVNVHRGNELLKAYSASATVVLKHRGGPDEQKVAKARQAIHEQLWSGLVGQMVADREFLASALVASKQQPIGELSP